MSAQFPLHKLFAGLLCFGDSAKYNQLLRIEEELGDAARFIGKDVFYNLK